jgi:hypothetical protein
LQITLKGKRVIENRDYGLLNSDFKSEISIQNQNSKISRCTRNCKLKSLLLSTKPLFVFTNGKVNNKTQARRPAYYIEYQTFGKKGLGMGNSMLFSHF